MATATKSAAKKAAPRKAAAGTSKRTTAKKAPAKQSAAKKPLEADDPEFRERLRPTKALLSEQPCAVVMLAWVTDRGTDCGKPTDRDFERCEDEDIAQVFFEEFGAFHASDVKEHGDVWYATVLVTDTEKLSIGNIEVASTNDEWAKATEEYIREVPDVLVSNSRRDAIKAVGTAGGGVKKPRATKKATTTKSDDKPEYTDEELANWDPEKLDELPPGTKGKALALRRKKARADKEAAAEATTEEAPPEKPKAPRSRKRPTAKPKPAEASDSNDGDE